ncbi:MAG: lipid II flippase MurJ [Lentisphaeria bacterium]|nr:lipid II flippase MurJ [Lentisphaeria bacterium]
MNETTRDHRKHIGERILRASTVVAIAHVCLKVVGLAQLSVLGRYIDTSVLDVVYVGAFEGCIFTIFLLGEEVIGPAFLPVFMRELDDRGKKAAWAFANTVLTLQFMILALLIGALTLWPAFFINLVTNWQGEDAPAKIELARRSLIAMAPALLCLSLGSTTYIILNGHKRFFLAAFGDASWKIVSLISVFVGIGWLGMNVRALIFGLVIGSVAKLGTHLVGLFRELRFFRPSLVLKNPALKTMLLLMLPLIAGILFAKIRDVFNNQYILSSIQTDGLMTANSFGRKLYTAIGWLVPYAMSIAMFPFFCELVDRDDHEHLGDLLTHSGRMLLAVFIPFSMACVVFSQPLTSLLFQSGKFGPDVTALTALSMACYTLVFPAFALEYLIIQAFFANRKMISVTVIGALTSVISIVISYVGIRLFGATDAAALMVVALGFVISRTIKTTAFMVLLKRTTPAFPLLPTAVMVLKAVLTGGCAMLLCQVTDQAFLTFISGDAGKFPTILRLAANGGAAAAGFLGGALIFRLKEPFEMAQWAFRKMTGQNRLTVKEMP